MITENQILKFSGTLKMVPVVTKWFNEYAARYEVDTPLRIAAFLSQVIHESAAFRYTRELASGQAYEGREDLGNTHPGDGVRFKGRGYIQITGRSNYAAMSKEIFGNRQGLLDNPDILSSPQYAMLSAFWFWKSRDLNLYADIQDMKGLTHKINGGLNGYKERVHIYNTICIDFGLPVIPMK